MSTHYCSNCHRMSVPLHYGLMRHLPFPVLLVAVVGVVISAGGTAPPPDLPHRGSILAGIWMVLGLLIAWAGSLIVRAVRWHLRSGSCPHCHYPWPSPLPLVAPAAAANAREQP